MTIKNTKIIKVFLLFAIGFVFTVGIYFSVFHFKPTNKEPQRVYKPLSTQDEAIVNRQIELMLKAQKNKVTAIETSSQNDISDTVVVETTETTDTQETASNSVIKPPAKTPTNIDEDLVIEDFHTTREPNADGTIDFGPNTVVKEIIPDPKDIVMSTSIGDMEKYVSKMKAENNPALKPMIEQMEKIVNSGGRIPVAKD